MTTSKPARGARSERPIMVLLDLLSRRWTLRLIWELRGGPLTFRALRAAAGDLSPSVLQTRLNELREVGFVATSSAGYQLTALGLDLLSTFLPLHGFAQRWAERPAETDDPPGRDVS